MKLNLILLAGLLAFGYATTATAGNVTDTDSDLVPDAFDNCTNDANGPNQSNNQVDFDNDGYGNLCDGDFNNSGGNVDINDFNVFLGEFGNPSTGATDMDADGDTDINDFNRFLAVFGGPPGPSGLSCAGTVPCTP